MNMKNIRSIIVLSALFALVLMGSASAQTTLNSTTWSSAVSPTQTSVVLASVTCTNCTFAAGIRLWADLEMMQVAGSYVSGTTVPVIRGVNGTQVAAHASGATVFLGPGERFATRDPPNGPCNRFIQNVNGYYPWHNITTGGEWLCDNGQNNFNAVLWRVIYPYAIGTSAASR